ncbi:MAG: DHH family phosphoesterase [Candidatus Diapherotrites archaeon]
MFTENDSKSFPCWVVAVGILGDSGLTQWRQFVLRACKRAGLSLKQMDSLKEMVCAVEAFAPEKFNALLKEFFKFYDVPKKLFKSPLFKYKKLLDREMKKLLKKAGRETKKFPEIELMVFSFKSSHDLKSALINRLSAKNPHKTVLVLKDIGKGKIRFSARRQDFKVKMNDLLEKAMKGLNGTAGGHTPAAAGRVGRKQVEKFKENVRKELQKIYK